MTRKQKEQAYRKAAELVNKDNTVGLITACNNAGMPTNSKPEIFILWSLYAKSGYSGIMTQSLRETILLSCAEIVRLNFKTE